MVEGNVKKKKKKKKEERKNKRKKERKKKGMLPVVPALKLSPIDFREPHITFITLVITLAID